MELTQDFKELLRLFEKNEVKYLVVGGYAVNYYGYPRYTHDIDLWIWTTEKNAKKVKNSIIEFGFSSFNLIIDDLMAPERVIQLGHPPHRIDLLTSIDGVQFQKAFDDKNLVTIDDLIIPFISLSDLISNKNASQRLQDLADAEQLEKINNSKK